MSNRMGGQLRTQYLRVQASNIRADATEAEQDWLEVADSLDDAADEVDQLRKDNDDYDSILIRQGDLLTGVANAVRGAPPGRTIWSHADLPERVARLRTVVENAPHANGCDMTWSEVNRHPTDFCTCWKADAL